MPPGLNKASGLKAALEDLGVSAHNVVSIGDAENDHAFLSASGYASYERRSVRVIPILDVFWH